MSVRPQFTDAEWRTLQKTPIWAFLITASVDNKVDNKEVEAFSKELAEASLYKDELAREVFSSLVADFSEVFPSCMLAPQEALICLRDAGQLVDTKGGEHAEGFKGAVMNHLQECGRGVRGHVGRQGFQGGEGCHGDRRGESWRAPGLTVVDSERRPT